MRVLIATKIFPSARHPAMAPYNRQQFVALSRLCDVELLATLPWFPGESAVAKLRGRPWQAVPPRALVDGLKLRHPKVLYLPKVGQPLAGLTYAASLAPIALPLRGKVDVVLGAFAYPDGFAAICLARLLGVNAVIKVHGSDVNVLSEVPHLKPLLSWALANAWAVVGPSQALVDKAVSLGANPRNSRRILNGVDKAVFHPRSRASAELALGLPPKRRILFVGRLEPQKGCAELLQAFRALAARIPELELVMLGDGPHAAAYQREASGLPVRFPGNRPHEEIATWLGACEVLALPSWAEGTPNVVIEALVCGRPVVATAVGGIPAVVNSPLLGVLVEPKQEAELERALEQVLGRPHDPQQVADGAGFGDWDHSARELHSVLREAAQTN